MKTTLIALIACVIWGWADWAVAEGPTATAVTALDDYVAAPDPSYSWKLAGTYREDGVTTYVVDLTSQSWRSMNEVDRTLWKHWLVIAKPDGATARKAMMFIGGGSNGRAAPKRADDRTLQIAKATQSVVAELGMIPNQPLVFHGDGVRRVEDDLIGYAWDQYFKTRDPLWAPRLPMVKAVVRAMDATQELLASEAGGNLQIDKFVVAGGSKRGWTTWMTAAADPRVCAIMPIVIDVLNVKVSMDHHFASYGFWAPAIDDYVNHNITQRRNTPAYRELLQLVDPYAYRSRYTMPKCIINATGDEFFLPDSSQFYYDDLPSEKHLCYVPNGNHSLRDTNALDTLVAFYYAILHDVPRPEFRWEFAGDDMIRVQTTQGAPSKVLLWQAHNPQARDFRVESIGKAYQSQPLQSAGDNVYVGKVTRPAQGWTAFLVQLEYDLGAPTPLRLSTAVRVTPETLPFQDKEAPLSQ